MILSVIDPKRELQLFEAMAGTGVGVFETLKTVSRLVLERLSKNK